MYAVWMVPKQLPAKQSGPPLGSCDGVYVYILGTLLWKIRFIIWEGEKKEDRILISHKIKTE